MKRHTYFNIKTLATILVYTTLVYGQNKRQVGKSGGAVNTEQDHQAAETGFGANTGGHGKYFQYAHVPEKDHYEFGHRKGNDYHFKERHEKAHPEEGEFKTKVRWGDKHGGYGEHYWDYNHAGHGHHDGDGEESQTFEEYENYEPSATSKKTQTLQNHKTDHILREKRQEDTSTQPILNNKMKFVYDSELGILTDEISGKSFKLEPIT